MEPLSMEAFEVLLQRAGLSLTPQDKERLKGIFEQYRERLQVLYTADLDNEEVAGIFPPQ